MYDLKLGTTDPVALIDSHVEPILGVPIIRTVIY